MRYSEYVEKKKRGSEGFPLQYYYLDKEQPQYVMETHWHNDFEIIRVLSGRFNVYLDNELHTLNGGDVIFVECGRLHRGIPEECAYECIVFDLNMLRRRSEDAAERLLAPIVKGEVGVRCRLSPDDSSLYPCVSALFETVRNPFRYYELCTYSLLFRLFAELYAGGYALHSYRTKRSSQVERISGLLDWIDENYARHITLDRLSQISGISRKYICRIFKKYTDKTPICYINEIRIENACYELSSENISVTDVAYNNGFDDVSYFSKLFKAHKGISPSEYRKKSAPQKNGAAQK